MVPVEFPVEGVFKDDQDHCLIFVALARKPALRTYAHIPAARVGAEEVAGRSELGWLDM